MLRPLNSERFMDNYYGRNASLISGHGATRRKRQSESPNLRAHHLTCETSQGLEPSHACSVDLEPLRIALQALHVPHLTPEPLCRGEHVVAHIAVHQPAGHRSWGLGSDVRHDPDQ